MALPSPFEVEQYASQAGCLTPALLAAAVPELAPATLARLQAHPRLAHSLGALVAERQGLPPCAASDFGGRTARLALRPAHQLAAIARLCAATWHANAMRACIGKQDVARLVSLVGEQARAFALRNADLAGAPAGLWEGGALGAAIEASAGPCLKVWCDGLPPGVAGRLRLKMPAEAVDALPGAWPAASDRPAVERIMERIAQELGDAGD